jgi:hypothetical protein
MSDYTTLFDAVLMERDRREAELNRTGTIANRASRPKARRVIAVGLLKIATWVAGETLPLVPARSERAATA